MAYSGKSFVKGEGTGLNRVVNQETFLYFLDLEVKRSRRYQNFFCVLILKFKETPEGNGGKRLQACYQRLTHLLRGEIRDSDILGALGEKKLAVLLPYADTSAGSCTRSRFENTLQFCDFRREGYQLVVEQVCFPGDGADTPDLIRKVVGTGASNS
jgi:GGDEF domain-containing protein